MLLSLLYFPSPYCVICRKYNENNVTAIPLLYIPQYIDKKERSSIVAEDRFFINLTRDIYLRTVIIMRG